VQIAEPASSGLEYYGKLAKRKVVGIYISGHPLTIINLRCNILQHTFNQKFENLVGKMYVLELSATYNTEQENGKDWAMFTLEGYDEF
jgi:DNA polymerase-3 subunit alpha